VNVDLSPQAITLRLKRTAQLRNLCLSLARAAARKAPEPAKPKE
jgi:hypothetical protein